MILFRKLREIAGNWLLRKQLKKLRRNIEMKKLDELRDVGIFFDASSENCRKTVKAFIKKLDGKKITTRSIGFFNTLKPEVDFISDKKLYFSTLKDFSFFFLPKSEELKDFVEKEFDALFVFSSDDSFSTTAMVKKSGAKLKIGFSDLFDNALDLTFEIPNHEPEQLTEQIERYL